MEEPADEVAEEEQEVIETPASEQTQVVPSETETNDASIGQIEEIEDEKMPNVARIIIEGVAFVSILLALVLIIMFLIAKKRNSEDETEE